MRISCISPANLSDQILPTEPVYAEPAPPTTVAVKLNGFDAAAQTLTTAFEAKAIGRVFRVPEGCPSFARRTRVYRELGGLLQQVRHGLCAYRW